MSSLRILPKPWQFRQVYRNGRKIDCKYAVLFYYQTGHTGDAPHFGVVASKRLGGAVLRNRAKRLLREAAAGIAGRLLHDDVWIVLVARSGILDVTSQEVLAQIRRRLVDEGLINHLPSS